tara:strand:- start:430 stop:696 length:267 start_codon:yes stop_codon:yes gene_type:complete
MKKKLLFRSIFILLVSTPLFASETDCNQFDKLSAKYIECTAKKLKTTTGEKFNAGKKKLSGTSLTDTWTKFKNSKNGKEFMEKLKDDN